MTKRSAGILLFRRGKTAELEVFLVHPGGPFWANKDRAAWSIPKGGYEPNEAALDAAKREFHEETGFVIEGEPLALGEVKQGSGKIVTAWALRGDCDPALLKSNTFLHEWPPRSGKFIDVPEVDRGAWFSIAEARDKLISAQCAFLDRLLALPIA